MLTLAAILFPSLGAVTLCGDVHCGATSNRSVLDHLSVGIAVVLLLAYIAYIAFGIFGWERLSGPGQDGEEARELTERAHSHVGKRWPVWLSVCILAGSTILLIPIVDILTGTVESVTKVLGWSQVFVGIVIVANAGNVAEGYAAIRLAFLRGGADPTVTDSGLDLSLGIASASSIQIATFVAPIVVLYSLTAHTMNLVFSLVEVAILGLLVIIFAYIGQDGESHWLEGVQLIALYAMATIVFYALPPSVFGG
jgi:Ca2+:H+ antiporter